MKIPVPPLLRFEEPSAAVYIELVDELFRVIPPMVILALSLGAVGLAIFVRTGDVPILLLTIAGFLIASERVLLVLRYRRATASEPLSVDAARLWQRRFAARAVVTGSIISAIGVRSFMLPQASVHMLIIALLVAFGAGVVTRVVYRPVLAVTCLLILSIPPTIACLFHGGTVYLCLAALQVLFLFGAIETVQHLYGTIVSQLTLKLSFAGLARLDPLTGLSNRLVLNENLERLVATAHRTGDGLAIHSLDLNHFKAANDRFGHPVGDALLKEVARRLALLTRTSDVLVRLGGDEFVLVQTGVNHREQTLALAARIVSDINAPYHVDGNMIELGTSIGIAMLAGDLLTADELLARADQALYQAKRSGTGISVYAVAPQLVPIGDDQSQNSDVADERKTFGRR
jgi:diguanylate cyclase (GGDEF)-like protein